MLWMPLVLAVTWLVVAILLTAAVDRFVPSWTPAVACVLIGGTAAHLLAIGAAYLGVPLPAFDFRGAHLGAPYWAPLVAAGLGLILAVFGRRALRIGLHG